MIFAAVDVETTGLDPIKDDVIEVGCVLMDTSGTLIDEYVKYCRPFSPIPPDATEINKITNEMVQDCPPYTDLQGEVAEFLRQAEVIAGHNLIEFDLKFLKIDIPYRKLYDTLEESRKKYKGVRHGLAAMCKYLHIPWEKDKAHGARYDALKSGMLYIEMEHPKNKVEQTSFIADKPGGEKKPVHAPAHTPAHAPVHTSKPTVVSIMKQKVENIKKYRESDTPYLAGDTLVIPMKCQDKYKWWKEGSQPVKQTLEELNAPQHVIDKYVSEGGGIQI